MEKVKEDEKKELAKMTSELYEKSRLMANLQMEIEDITERNKALELDFENEINKKNNTNKEVGQIINSINNIYGICKQIKTDQGKQTSKELDRDNLQEKELIESLIKKLKDSVTTVGDLVELLKKLPSDKDAEWFYEESAKR